MGGNHIDDDAAMVIIEAALQKPPLYPLSKDYEPFELRLDNGFAMKWENKITMNIVQQIIAMSESVAKPQNQLKIILGYSLKKNRKDAQKVKFTSCQISGTKIYL